MVNRLQDDIIKNWPQQWDVPTVSIRCITYNHELYISQALDGFLMQETTFPFEIVVHDDASTDKTAVIIREYEEKYPKIVKPIYETENQYYKPGNPLGKIMNNACKGKYIARCEGDDYWTDAHKLQIQVDFLEAHPDYSMCCSDAVILKQQKCLNWTCYNKDIDIPTTNMILGGGSFIQTCTLVYRRTLLNNYPDCCTQCHVGDYPLQIWAALNGKVRFFSKKMGAYRYLSAGSWTSKQQEEKHLQQISGWYSEIKMLQGLDNYSSQRFHTSFKKRQTIYIIDQSCFNGGKLRPTKDIAFFFESFPEIRSQFNFIQKIEYYLITHNFRFIFQLFRFFKTIVKTALFPTKFNRYLLRLKLYR